MHAHEFAMNTYGSIASAITRIPIITTVHGKNYYHDKWRRRLAYRFVSKQSRMVAVSEDIKKFLIKEIGIKNGRITTIYNGINLNLYRPDNNQRYKVRKELGINNNQPLIGTIGNLYPVKGHTYLLKAMAIVKKMCPVIKLLITGRGRLLDELKREAIKLDIEKNVNFLGFREDIPSLLQAIDIFVLPSISEGLPLSALEAMACEKPVVATNVGGVPEVIINGKTGFLVSPWNSEALAEKILLLLRNKNMANHFGRAGRARVEKEFNLEIMIQRYQELYESIRKQEKKINCHQ
jgi:glycosyltransferase involved in cell wall biosynthesis